MRCPKCEEGTILHVVLKMTGERVSICDYCETLWQIGEDIAISTGHPFDITRQGSAIEHTLEEAEEKDQEHRSVNYTDMK